MQLVHEAVRQDNFDTAAIQAGLEQAARSFYNDELTLMAAAHGCDGRHGQLEDGGIQADIDADAAADATSIVNTFNYDLAVAIAHIRQEHPRANRYHYARYLSAWNERRAAWKDGQIATMTEGKARNRAQADFLRRNDLRDGKAHLLPVRAVCPICQGLVARGDVPVAVAYANPMPAHPNCVPPGEMVLMANGGLQSIETVPVGAEVASGNGTTRVLAVYRRHAQEDIYRIIVAGVTAFRVTGGHPVMTTDGWRNAQDLHQRDLVKFGVDKPLFDASYGRISRVIPTPYEGPVYNLKTEAEQYVVGGIIIHNCPHIWHVDGRELPEDRCALLWMG